jgi:flagellar biosynthesis protein
MNSPSQEEISRWWDHFESEDELFREEQLKDKYAFALSLDERTGMPRITAMGRGLFAKRIEQRAQEAGVQVEHDPDMAQRLFRPTEDSVIHPRLYGVIAEILTFVYQLNEMVDRNGFEAGAEEIPQMEQDEQPEETWEEAEQTQDEELTEEYQDEFEDEEDLILEDLEEIN